MDVAGVSRCSAWAGQGDRPRVTDLEVMHGGTVYDRRTSCSS